MLDLISPQTFRDRTRPIGTTGKSRFEELLTRRKELCGFEECTYLYFSSAMRSLALDVWLLPIEPFTTDHIQLQSGKFDQANLFTSIADSWLFYKSNLNNYRELPPEFFFSPYFRSNENGFDLGEHRGQRLSAVELPPWASGSPITFVYLQREALESDYACEHLNHWIDLVWASNSEGPRPLTQTMSAGTTCATRSGPRQRWAIRAATSSGTPRPKSSKRSRGGR
jgi:hypothetical protein